MSSIDFTNTDLSKTDFIKSLLDPSVYPHRVERCRLVETHISWVILTGEYAYKIKKPVNFGFLDFSTLEKRRQCCELEIRLNSRLAPAIYLDVVAIGASMDGHASLQSVTQPVEYAVRMRQFDDNALYDRMLQQNQLTTQHIDTVADVIAKFHQGIEVAATDTDYGTANAVSSPMLENFAQIRTAATDSDLFAALSELEKWTRNQLEQKVDILRYRKSAGFIRECHGDLHLRNIAWVNQQPLVFDGIEFNPHLRWIDTSSEIAFLVMDLQDHGRADFAFRFLNRYLELSGDYECLSLLPLYLVYRAMVRAKVAALRLTQMDLDVPSKNNVYRELTTYRTLAHDYTQPRSPCLIIMFGLSGSGKSHLAQYLAEALQGIRIRSDVERKRLQHIPLERHASTRAGQGIYSSDITMLTYQRLASLASRCLKSGYPCITDATFLQTTQRDLLREVAHECQVPFCIIKLDVPEAVLKARLENRRDDVSEANLDVLQQQKANLEPLGPEELKQSISWPYEDPPEYGNINQQLILKLSRF